MSARVQTWFPFSILVCINGREWLARRLDEQGMAYNDRYAEALAALDTTTPLGQLCEVFNNPWG
jgi:hypothetical protein